MSILDNARIKLKKLIEKNKLDITQPVQIKILTSRDAIGDTGRDDFPIIKGRERVIEATFLDLKAQAFTDSPSEFEGKIKDILSLPLDSNEKRAQFIATLNVLLKYMNQIEKTLHCKDKEPINCAEEISLAMLEKFGNAIVGLIGLNPAIAEKLVYQFGVENVNISDLDIKNIDSFKYGVKILDGSLMNEMLIRNSKLILITGTTFINGTFDNIYKDIMDFNKNYFIFGVTGTGICKLMELNHICPYGRA